MKECLCVFFVCLTTSMFINLVHVDDDIETFRQVEKLFLMLELHRKFEFYLKTRKVVARIFMSGETNLECKRVYIQKLYFYETKADEMRYTHERV